MPARASNPTTTAKRCAQWNRAALAYQARKRRELEDLRSENANLAAELRALASARRDLEREMEVLRTLIYGYGDGDTDAERRRRVDEDYLALEATRAQLDAYHAFHRAVTEARPRLAFRDGTLITPDAAREALDASHFEALRLCSLPLAGTGPWSPDAAFSPPTVVVNEPLRSSSMRFLRGKDGRVFVRRDTVVSRAGAPRLTAESAMKFYTGFFTDFEFVLSNARGGRVAPPGCHGPLAPWESFDVEDPETRTTSRAIRLLDAPDRDSLFVAREASFGEMPLGALDPAAGPGVVTCRGLVRVGEFRERPTTSESDPTRSSAGEGSSVAEPLGRRVARLGSLKHTILAWDAPESESVRIVMVGQFPPNFRFWGSDRGELVRDGALSEYVLRLMRSEEDMCFDLHR